MSPRITLSVSLALALSAPALSLWWLFRAQAAAAEARAAAHLTQLELARASLDEHLGDSLWAIERLATFVANDARVRAAMTTETLDSATLLDALQEVQELAHLDLISLVAPDGTVAASAGVAELSVHRGLSLAESDALRGATEGRHASSVWFQGDAALLVSLVAITHHDEVVGVALVGRLLDRQALVSMGDQLKGVVGLSGPHGEWFGSAARPPEAPSLPLRESRHLKAVQVSVTAPRPPPGGALWVPFALMLPLVIWILLLTLKGRHASA